MGNCKHFPDAEGECLICANQMELHLLTINLPKDEVDFAEQRIFTDAKAIQDYADANHPNWTSMVIVATKPKGH